MLVSVLHYIRYEHFLVVVVIMVDMCDDVPTLRDRVYMDICKDQLQVGE